MYRPSTPDVSESVTCKWFALCCSWRKNHRQQRTATRKWKHWRTSWRVGGLLARALQALSDPYSQSTTRRLCLYVCVSATLMLYISETKRFRGLCLEESAYGESISDVTDDVTWLCEVRGFNRWRRSVCLSVCLSVCRQHRQLIFIRQREPL